MIIWPSSFHLSFEDAISDAIKTKTSIEIEPRSEVILFSPIFLKVNSCEISIIGRSESDVDRPKIVSTGHSVFQVEGRHTNLKLHNLVILHECYSNDRRDIGAAVFSLNLSSVHISSCYLLSEHGFGIWCVQKSKVNIDKCYITSLKRSGCVAFGKSALRMSNTTVQSCGIHSVCSRGNVTVYLDSCRLLDAAKRSLYAYHSVSLSIVNSLIEGTQSSEYAAVDIFFSTPKENDFAQRHPQFNNANRNFISKEISPRYVDGSGTKKHVQSAITLLLKDSQIIRNNGIGLLLHHTTEDSEDVNLNDKIQYEIENCVIEDNTNGNIVLRNDHIVLMDESVEQTKVAVEIDGIKSASKTITALSGCDLTTRSRSPDMTLALPLEINWFYERDDPLILKSIWVSRCTSNEMTGSGYWTQFCPQDCASIEEMFMANRILITAHERICTAGSIDSNTEKGLCDNYLGWSGYYKRHGTEQIYDLNFDEMIQSNRETHYIRRIKRVDGISIPISHL